ncbi:MAG: hypothetical protein HYS81_03405 [Candidatus Aenigmatarchaeota archaeon]|nr:MAG: hypothetical protein HYS81_03405 [Candidatus Aenigmarchaeota archaeon]
MKRSKSRVTRPAAAKSTEKRGRWGKKIVIPKDRIPYILAVLVLTGLFAAGGVASGQSRLDMNVLSDPTELAHVQSDVFPQEGFKTKVVLGDAIPKLVESGVINLDKIRELYGDRLTEEQLRLFTEPTNEHLVLTPQNANSLINPLWALGIANKNPILDETLEYEGVGNLASTGGWSLAKEDAMTYYNKLEIVKLTSEQQTVFEKVARSTYRPCCDNPTAFPDCNHGAALLALLELGASQGLNEDELYTLALQANTLWFPQQYLSTATLYKAEGKDYWSDARTIVGFDYSSYSGWAKNVYKPLQDKGLLPKAEGGGSCGV